MGTKYLARTAIEGGRAWGNCWERRHSHDPVRAHERERMHALARDPHSSDDDTDDYVAPPRHVWKSFRDKLGAPDRWLRSHVGQTWDAVYSELKRSFDPRTTAGRHIVYDHMLGWVRQPGEVEDRWRWYRFFVDDEGILREAAPRRRRRHQRTWATKREQDAAHAFAGGRVVGGRGAHLFWFEPTTPRTKDAPRTYRQGRQLTSDERRAYEALAWQARPAITIDVYQESNWDVTLRVRRPDCRSGETGSSPVRPANGTRSRIGRELAAQRRLQIDARRVRSPGDLPCCSGSSKVECPAEARKVEVRVLPGALISRRGGRRAGALPCKQSRAGSTPILSTVRHAHDARGAPML